MGTDITDACGLPGHADQVFSPETESIEVATILLRASAGKTPVTAMRRSPLGFGWGRLRQGGWGVSLTRLRRLEILPGKAIVGAGTLLRDVQAAAAASGQFYAPDPTPRTPPQSEAISPPTRAGRAASAMAQPANMSSPCVSR